MSPCLEHYGIKFGTTDDNTRWLEAAPGITYAADDLRVITSRVRMLIDSCNVLCARSLEEIPVEAKPIGALFAFPQAGWPTDPDELRRVQEDYCWIRGYDQNSGVPTRDKLEKPGLKGTADRLEAGKKA